MARTPGSRGEKTARAVEASAAALFARHGYAAVTMRQIAADVGVQVGTLYSHIPDKQALLFRIMQAHMAELHAAWEAEAALPLAPRAALERFVRFHLSFHLKRPQAVFIAYMELRNLTEENFGKIEASRRAYEDALESIIADGVAQNAFCVEDPRLATYAIIAMLTAVTAWYRPGGRLAPDEIEARYLAMCLSLLRA